MSDKEIEDVGLVKRLIKKEKHEEKRKSLSIKETIDQIPRKYRDKFDKEFKGRIPSRRDVDLFLRKHNLTTKK